MSRYLIQTSNGEEGIGRAFYGKPGCYRIGKFAQANTPGITFEDGMRIDDNEKNFPPEVFVWYDPVPCYPGQSTLLYRIILLLKNLNGSAMTY